jgi:hypothetical protein
MPPNLCEYLFDSLLIDFGHEPGEVVVLVAKFQDHIDDIRTVGKIQAPVVHDHNIGLCLLDAKAYNTL